jgi:hypothetical protein
MEADVLVPATITANSLLVWFVEGLFFGIGFGLAWHLIGVPVRRYWP